ncbi:hypothetical protein XBJ1_4011 [Xenorhabdus bovienii SS-2004]|uniref:Uncharacterized protein n=1 Tax=Xenorhabdus bovienii (strain SS-2004) TaxID=406818 RepID=D3V650_XENBS|nr:hypothetical protein XBJ1_4011 [Xenorhabdus bovienii SS-2004]
MPDIYLAREATPPGGFFAFVFFYYLLNFCFILFLITLSYSIE